MMNNEIPRRRETKLGVGALVRTLAKDPAPIDFYALMRHIEAAAERQARIGYAMTTREEAVRLGQFPSTIFAPTTIHSIDVRAKHAPIVRVLSLGLFGPNGPLPLHITEYVRDRVRNSGDTTMMAFADIFHHRVLSLFYRAWADAQPAVQLDRAQDNRFSAYVGALSGYGLDSMRGRDCVDDRAKLFATGNLVRMTRDPESLCRLLSHFFSVAVQLHEFIRSWIEIPKDQQTRLSGAGSYNRLGYDAVAGARTPDVQSSFRLELGPLSLARYEQFLPGSIDNIKLRDWVRNYVGLEFAWDVDLVLRADEIPSIKLGASLRLGWTTWLGKRSSNEPAKDLRLQPENCKSRANHTK